VVVTPENMTSADGQHALQDMIEFKMYIVAQTQEKPWPMLPRSVKNRKGARKPYSNVVASSVARELVALGFIEAVSSQTFIVSKSGDQFYSSAIRPKAELVPLA
jgi:hypothetical protein